MKLNNKGMTVIELIIAIAILGILTLAVAGFLSFGIKGFQKTNEIVDEQALMRLGANQVSEILRDAKEIVVNDTIPSPPTAGKCYIYSDGGDLKYVNDTNVRNLIGDFSPIINFLINKDANNNINLEFSIQSNSGYTVNSSVMLTNYSAKIDSSYRETYSGNDGDTGTVIMFTLPED